ncbi:MAG: iron-sulfur cluster-binding protein [SAR202 cluster bacterium Io17-Chloro-G2]|nr:MAG: iron-sulfur cluster-binding protein [SAR202 cluster bacterium Io17-Chloro-G2]
MSRTEELPGVQANRPGGRPTVAVVATRPETVFDDMQRVMELAGVTQHLDSDTATLLKINISWQHWYPGCSTSPWQLEGVIRGLRNLGYQNLIGAHNGTVVVDSFEGEEKNKHKAVQDKLSLPVLHLDSPPNKWVQFKPKEKMLVLDDIFPEGIQIPESFAGKNIIQLPTMKTHVFTTMTGAMKNAFGGLLHRKRHWTHSVIHETLVDLLAIQQEIHPGVFAVMDGTFAGDGPGPRAMRWHIKNRILASADQVAIDAVAAKMMGFDPMSIKFIRLAHERGLGCGDVSKIDVVGEDISQVNWGFTGVENTFASRGQKLIYWGPLKPLENFLLRSPLVGLSYLASNLYHNGYWLKTKGRSRIKEALKTEWGELFKSY